MRPPLHHPTNQDQTLIDSSPTADHLTVVTTCTSDDNKEESLLILDASTGIQIAEYRPMQHIWVEMGADSSRTHGPRLRLRLLADEHPAVHAAKKLSYQHLPGTSTKSEKSSGVNITEREEPSAMQRVMRQRAAKPYRPPEMFGSSSSTNSVRPDIGITATREGSGPKGPPPGFEKEVSNLGQAFSGLAVGSKEGSPSTTTASAAGVAGGSGGGNIGAEGRGIVVEVPMDSYLENVDDTSAHVMEAAVKLLHSKAARYAAKAEGLDPRSKEAGRWSAKAAACRIEASKLREHLRKQWVNKNNW